MLALDLGNSHASAGLFHNDELFLRQDAKAGHLKELFDAFEMDTISQCVVSDTRHAADDRIALETLPKHIALLKIDHTKVPFTIDYQKPNTLGSDRIANVMGTKKYAPTGAIVVDVGTAIHFDVLDSQNVFRAGPIICGISTMIDAITTRVPHLPKIHKKNKCTAVITQSTENALNTGATLAAISTIKYVLKNIQHFLGENLRIILTGGDANIVAPHLHNALWIPNLTLNGLASYHAHVTKMSPLTHDAK